MLRTIYGLWGIYCGGVEGDHAELPVIPEVKLNRDWKGFFLQIDHDGPYKW